MEIAGQTVLEAEKLVKKHLSKLVKNPQVSLSVIDSAQTRATSNLRYDGKTFNYWKTAWRQDLSIRLRIEAVRAFVAFAGTKHGQEAVDEIMSIVDQYDWGTIGINRITSPLQNTCVAVFAERQIPTDLAVDAVIAAADSPSPRVRDFLGYILEPLSRTSREANETLRKRFPDRQLPRFRENSDGGGRF